MQVDGSTVVLGIFGDPVEHSLSPRMQNAAIAAAGINAVYVPFHVEKGAVGAAVAAVRALGLLGVNVTVPHKEAVLPYLDAIDAEAEMIGAVNTIVNRCGRLIGYNTDGQGFLASLRSDLAFDPGGRKAVVLGAGGAARAAVAALAKAGAAAVTIVNRSRDRAETLRETFRGPFPDTELSVCAMDPEKLEGFVLAADLLVNTTTVGLHGDSFDVPLVDLLPDGASVYDMVYATEPTPLQRSADGRGLRFADGRGMLAGQGEAAFRLWFDAAPEPGLMHAQIAK